MPAFAEQRAGVVIHFWTGLSKNLPGVREFETKVAQRLSKPSGKLFHVLETLLTPKKAIAILDKLSRKTVRCRECGLAVQCFCSKATGDKNEWYSRFGVREKM
jgi:hypothetical protein